MACRGTLCVAWFLVMTSQLLVISPTSAQTTATVNMNVTNSSTLMTTTQAPPSCPPDYTGCRCVFTREPSGHLHHHTGLLPHQRSALRDFITFLFGFPLGLVLSVASFCAYYNCKTVESIYRKPTKKWSWRSNIKGRVSPILRPDCKLKDK